MPRAHTPHATPDTDHANRVPVGRRAVLRGLAGGLPLAAVLADPALAAATAGGLESVTIATGDGRRVTGALAMPAGTPAAAVLLAHEWWGLNDQIKAVAAALADEGYVALALDLYGGRVAAPGDRAAARALMKAVDAGQANATVTAWARWLKAHKRSTGRIATIGWCFGGGVSLDTSIAEPVDATVVYYGRVDADAEELKALKGPVLGHFATRDKWIDRAMVSAFEAAMQKAGKIYTSHWYEAQHAFANPTSARYDREDAALAWRRTLDFLAQHLG